ncbi:uncharacterized protein LOC132396095 [Hypanus sabinus]|uniref:uncharacterized protein LOC132396095 n=1 Tax=Hypanus sabinus TaxID=79690 RepID=UPI0028C39A6B|nr:uncharacterized protein LOC132396095 [Hypanus sabinus]
MEAIQLTILALLVNGLMGSSTTDRISTANFSISIAQNTSLVENSNTTMSPTNASELPNSHHNITSNFTNLTSSTTSQMITLSSKPPTSSLASQSTSNVKTNNPPKSQTTKQVMRKSTTKKESNDNDHLNASMIIACIIGGLLLLLVVCIIGILLTKRCLRTNTVQDLSWAGTCPGPVGEDIEHASEGHDLNSAAVKRPSLTTFLTKKSKRDSLLDQYNMEVQQVQGIKNLASTETEEETPPEVKTDDDKEKEPLVLTETPSQEFPPPPETELPLNEGDQQSPALATNAEASNLPEGVPDTVSNNNDFPPPPMEFLDLVNDSDLPPPP